MQILTPFGINRRLYVNGQLRDDPPPNESILLRMTGQLAAGEVLNFQIPYNGPAQPLQVSTRDNTLQVTSRDYNAVRFCQGQIDVDPPFRGGQCNTVYQYSVTFWDAIERRRRTANLLQRGPLSRLTFNANGTLNMDGQVIAGGGENRIIAPRVINIKRRDGLPDNCGNIPGPNRYFCPENPYTILTLAPNESDSPYIANNWLLGLRVGSNVQSTYRIDFRV